MPGQKAYDVNALARPSRLKGQGRLNPDGEIRSLRACQSTGGGSVQIHGRSHQGARVELYSRGVNTVRDPGQGGDSHPVTGQIPGSEDRVELRGDRARAQQAIR